MWSSSTAMVLMVLPYMAVALDAASFSIFFPYFGGQWKGNFTLMTRKVRTTRGVTSILSHAFQH